jgi:hypothetical protein
MEANHLATLCHNWFTIPEPLQFTGDDLNNALLKDPAFKLDIAAEKSAPNRFGIYRDTYRPRDTNKRTYCYYLCDPNGEECVKSPPVGKKWYDTLPEDFAKEMQALERATRNQEQRQLPLEVLDLVTKANALVQDRSKIENERESKRRRVMTSADDTVEREDESEEDEDGNESSAPPEQTTSGPEPPRLAPGYNIWWDSTEAQKLFNASKEKETAVDRVE